MGAIELYDVFLLGALGLVAYFIGNISPSTIMAKRQGLDIKKEGSGNAGTTNALRVMGKKAGAITCIVVSARISARSACSWDMCGRSSTSSRAVKAWRQPSVLCWESIRCWR